MKKYFKLFFKQVMGSYLKKIKYIKTTQINLREWQVAAAINTIY